MRTTHQVATVATAILLAGAALGLALDANAGIPQPWNRVSSVIGWVYFFCWGAEFYPQVVLNYRRKSVEGYSLDSALLAILGFASYAVFNVAFYYSASVQELYMARHDGNRNAVELNDVFFSLHATTMVAIAIAQCLIYPSGDQRVSRTTKFIVYGTLSVAGAYAAAIPLSSRLDRSLVRLDVLDLLYYLSYVKLASTLAKEIPQLVLNYRRKSTRGWTVWTVLLDIPGCVLSIAQQVLDSWATSDWSAITGNPVKIGLACVSLTLNTLYILQHYYWFAENNALLELEQGGEKQPLLSTKANAMASIVPSYLSHSLWTGRASADEHAVDKSFWDVTAESARA